MRIMFVFLLGVFSLNSIGGKPSFGNYVSDNLNLSGKLSFQDDRELYIPKSVANGQGSSNLIENYLTEFLVQKNIDFKAIRYFSGKKESLIDMLHLLGESIFILKSHSLSFSAKVLSNKDFYVCSASIWLKKGTNKMDRLEFSDCSVTQEGFRGPFTTKKLHKSTMRRYKMY